MGDLVAVGLFAVLVIVGSAWMLKTKKALNERMKKLEAKKNDRHID